MRSRQVGLIALIIGLGGIAYTFWAIYYAIWPFESRPHFTDGWLYLADATINSLFWILVTCGGLAGFFGWAKPREDDEAKQKEGVKP